MRTSSDRWSFMEFSAYQSAKSASAFWPLGARARRAAPPTFPDKIRARRAPARAREAPTAARTHRGVDRSLRSAQICHRSAEHSLQAAEERVVGSDTRPLQIQHRFGAFPE